MVGGMIIIVVSRGMIIMLLSINRIGIVVRSGTIYSIGHSLSPQW